MGEIRSVGSLRADWEKDDGDGDGDGDGEVDLWRPRRERKGESEQNPRFTTEEIAGSRKRRRLEYFELGEGGA